MAFFKTRETPWNDFNLLRPAIFENYHNKEYWNPLPWKPNSRLTQYPLAPFWIRYFPWFSQLLKYESLGSIFRFSPSPPPIISKPVLSIISIRDPKIGLNPSLWVLVKTWVHSWRLLLVTIQGLAPWIFSEIYIFSNRFVANEMNSNKVAI